MRQNVRSLLMVLIAALALGGGVISPTVATAGAAAPPTQVPAAAPGSGTIAGRITAAGGAGLADVRVRVYSGWNRGDIARLTTTDADGNYAAEWLPPAAAYLVCFDARAARGGPAALGYASRCWQYKPWAPVNTVSANDPILVRPAVGSIPVRVDAGVVTSGIDAELTPASSVSGRVTAVDGTPVGGVRVKAGGALPVLTAADGRYTVTGLDASNGRVPVCFTPPGRYAGQCYRDVPFNPGPADAARELVAVTPGADTPDIDVVLQEASSISGSVTSADDGTPIVGAYVTASDSGGHEIQTTNAGPDGSYTLLGLTPAADGYRVCSSSYGFVATCLPSVPVTAGADTGGTDFGLAPSTDPAAATPDQATGATASTTAPVAGISGRVTTAANGVPLGKVRVVAYTPGGRRARTTATDANGAYLLSGLAGSTTGYIVCFDPKFNTSRDIPGYTGQCYGGTPWVPTTEAPPAGATPVVVDAGTVTTGIDVGLAAAGAISGTVTVAATGNPVPGMRVKVFDPAAGFVASTSTAPDGTYTVSRLAASTTGYVVCFDLGAYASQCSDNQPWYRFEPTPADARRVPVTAKTITTGIDAAVVPSSGITGRVTTADGATGIEGVAVYVFDSTGRSTVTFNNIGGVNQTVTTTADGSYQLTNLGLPSTGYTVCVGAADASGASPTGSLGYCRGSDTPWRPGEAPPAGSVPVVLDASSTTADVDIAVRPAAAISGTITSSPAGRPVPAGTVYAVNEFGLYAGLGATRADGTFTVSPLAPSTTGYRLCFLSYYDGGRCAPDVPWDTRTLAPTTATRVPVTDGQVTGGIDIVLGRTSTLSGRVTDAAGAPIGAATVRLIDEHGVEQYFEQTAGDGSYGFSAVRPSAAGYRVCVRYYLPVSVPGTGYSSGCYGAVDPGDATPVPVTAGGEVNGIDVVLVRSAAIGGTVTAEADETPLEGVYVVVFDAQDEIVGQQRSAADGSYLLGNIAVSATGYRVCFDPFFTPGYKPECFDNVSWTPRPMPSSRAATVTVTTATTTAGIDAALAATG